MFGTNVADDIYNKHVCNKREIYSLSLSTLSFKMRSNFLPTQ